MTKHELTIKITAENKTLLESLSNALHDEVFTVDDVKWEGSSIEEINDLLANPLFVMDLNSLAQVVSGETGGDISELKEIRISLSKQIRFDGINDYNELVIVRDGEKEVHCGIDTTDYFEMTPECNYSSFISNVTNVQIWQDEVTNVQVLSWFTPDCKQYMKENNIKLVYNEVEINLDGLDTDIMEDLGVETLEELNLLTSEEIELAFKPFEIESLEDWDS